MARQAYTDERGSVHGVNPGTELGRYTVETRIEEIPGGERWAARDTTLDRDVTLVVMPSDADSTAAALDAARRAAGVEAYAVEAIPRISRAQVMDALSSQANVAGYKSVVVAADVSTRFFPMLTTAAGTVKPATVLVLGVGVAGLQAIATARRLGAQVEGFDVRPETREQIESLAGIMGGQENAVTLLTADGEIRTVELPGLGWYRMVGQLGEDVSREGLLDTPKRAAKAMQYLCRGYQQTLEEVTNGALFSSDNSEMVLVKNSRLSVQPVTAGEWDIVLKLARDEAGD